MQTQATHQAILDAQADAAQFKQGLLDASIEAIRTTPDVGDAWYPLFSWHQSLIDAAFRGDEAAYWLAQVEGRWKDEPEEAVQNAVAFATLAAQYALQAAPSLRG